MEDETKLYLSPRDLKKNSRGKPAHDVELKDLDISDRLRREADVIIYEDASDYKVLKDRTGLPRTFPPKPHTRLNGELFEFRVWDGWHPHIYEKREDPEEREKKGGWVSSLDECWEGRLAHFFGWIETHAYDHDCKIEFRVVGEFDWIPLTVGCLFPQ